MILEKIILKTLPKKLKNSLINYLSQTFEIIGYKKISHDHKIPLIKFEDQTRLWILYQEIKKI